MRVNVTHDKGQARLAMEGRFDFGCRLDFGAACDSALAAADVREMVIDLGRVAYLDSAALGMLLLLRDKAAAANKTVSLANGQGVVGEVLRVARFDRLFTMN